MRQCQNLSEKRADRGDAPKIQPNRSPSRQTGKQPKARGGKFPPRAFHTIAAAPAASGFGREARTTAAAIPPRIGLPGEGVSGRPAARAPSPHAELLLQLGLRHGPMAADVVERLAQAMHELVEILLVEENLMPVVDRLAFGIDRLAALGNGQKIVVAARSSDVEK